MIPPRDITPAKAVAIHRAYVAAKEALETTDFTIFQDVMFKYFGWEVVKYGTLPASSHR